MLLRRRFLIAAGALLGAPLAGIAQPPARVWRIGFLGFPLPRGGRFLEAFRNALRDLGHAEGKNFAIEYREVPELSAQEARLRLASELVAHSVDVIVASVTRNALAAKSATSQIPIIMVNVGDPVDIGLAAGLAQSSGNVTGLFSNTAELVRRNLALLLEALPGTDRLGILANPANPLHPSMIVNARRAAKLHGLKRHVVNITAAGDIEGAVTGMAAERVGAMLVLQDGLFYLNRKQIAELALSHRLPTMFQNSDFAEAGGLMSYSPDPLENYRIAAAYVDRILRGAKPSDLPIQEHAKYELALNLRTARTLGITIPQSIVQRADRVIE